MMDCTDKKKVIVTGGCGFLGSHVVEECLSRGWDVTVIDDESAPENVEFYKFEGAKYHKLNVTEERCHALYEGVDYVFHLAARSRIQPSLHGDCFDTFWNNVLGTQSVCEAARRHGVKKIIYSGSSSFYGRKNIPPMLETMSCDCLNPYSLSKYQGEQMGELYHKLYGLSFVTLRYFNAYGPREPLRGQYAPVIGIFKLQKSRGEKLTIVGDGEQRRDFTFVKDIVRANMLAALNDSVKCDVFNIGAGKNYSINQIARLVGGETVNIAERVGEARLTLANYDKAKQMLGWEPRCALEEMINSY